MKVQAIQLSFSNVNHINLPQNNNSLTFNAKFKPAQQQEIKQKIGTNLITIVKRLGEESGNLIRNIIKRPELPIATTAIIAANWLSNRNANLKDDLNDALSELKKRHDNGNLTDAQYSSKVQEFKNYYNNAINNDTTHSSREIKAGEPSFSGHEDYGSTYDGSSVDDDSCDSDSGCDDDCCDSDSGDVDVGSCC